MSLDPLGSALYIGLAGARCVNPHLPERYFSITWLGQAQAGLKPGESEQASNTTHLVLLQESRTRILRWPSSHHSCPMAMSGM